MFKEYVIKKIDELGDLKDETLLSNLNSSYIKNVFDKYKNMYPKLNDEEIIKLSNIELINQIRNKRQDIDLEITILEDLLSFFQN